MEKYIFTEEMLKNAINRFYEGGVSSDYVIVDPYGVSELEQYKAFSNKTYPIMSFRAAKAHGLKILYSIKDC